MSSQSLRLLITGGSSFVGQYLVPMAQEKHLVAYTYFSQDPLALSYACPLNICEREATLQVIQSWQPDVIIHLAGSNRTPQMKDVIVKGTRHVVEGAKQVRARLIHLSTDVIFDGTQAPYVETDMPVPIHAYGQAKSEAEEIVKSYSNHVIVRTSLIYSLDQMDYGTRWLLDGMKRGEVLTLFTNQWRCPIWVETLCAALLELVELSFMGVLHIAGRQALTRAQFAVKLLDYYGISYMGKLHFASSPPNQWPIDVRLNSDLAIGILQTPLLGVDNVLAKKGNSSVGSL